MGTSETAPAGAKVVVSQGSSRIVVTAPANSHVCVVFEKDAAETANTAKTKTKTKTEPTFYAVSDLHKMHADPTCRYIAHAKEPDLVKYKICLDQRGRYTEDRDRWCKSSACVARRREMGFDD